MHRRPSAAAVALSVAAASSAALAQVEYGFTQITQFPFGTAVFEISIAAETADRVAFRTTGSLDGPNDGGNFEIFVYDRPSDSFTQLTDTPFGIGNFQPQITPDGGTVVFRALFDYVGDGNGGQFELYEVDVDTGVFRRLVDIPGGQVRDDFRLSGDGRFVVFVTSADLAGGNPDGNFEVFRVDRADGSIDQVTSSTAGLREFPDVSGDGRFVVYDGGSNIFLWDADTGLTTNLTNNPTNLRVDAPQISDDGRYVVFSSLAEFDPGEPGNGVFVLDRETGLFDRVVFPAIDNEDNDPFTMEMAPDGSAVFLESDALGANRQLYRYDIQTEAIDRLTPGPALISDAQLSTDASRRYVSVALDGTIAYRSEQTNLDPEISNDDGTNLDLFVGVPTPEACSPADINADGQITFGDVIAFIDAFNAGSLAADANGDGEISFGDVIAFIDAFNAGCP